MGDIFPGQDSAVETTRKHYSQDPLTFFPLVIISACYQPHTLPDTVLAPRYQRQLLAFFISHKLERI